MLSLYPARAVLKIHFLNNVSVTAPLWLEAALDCGCEKESSFSVGDAFEASLWISQFKHGQYRCGSGYMIVMDVVCVNRHYLNVMYLVSEWM